MTIIPLELFINLMQKRKFIVWKIYSIVTDLFTAIRKECEIGLLIPRSTGYESLHF